jgi:hypothetical protein
MEGGGTFISSSTKLKATLNESATIFWKLSLQGNKIRHRKAKERSAVKNGKEGRDKNGVVGEPE